MSTGLVTNLLSSTNLGNLIASSMNEQNCVDVRMAGEEEDDDDEGERVLCTQTNSQTNIKDVLISHATAFFLLLNSMLLGMNSSILIQALLA